jgi:hypothetical protein
VRKRFLKIRPGSEWFRHRRSAEQDCMKLSTATN